MGAAPAAERPRAYRPLPIRADEGFPQSFRLQLGNQVYQLVLYVNAAEELLEGTPVEAVLDLPRPAGDAYLVLRVEREATAGAEPAVLLVRKLVPGLDYEAGQLAFTFTEMRVAVRNLNGAGAYGSSVKGGVALRWASSSGIA
jgi:hypothetical protein